MAPMKTKDGDTVQGSAIERCKNKKIMPFLIRASMIMSLMRIFIRSRKKREEMWRRAGYIHFSTYDDDNYEVGSFY